MPLKKQLYKELSDLLGVDPPLTPDSLYISKERLESLLTQLKNCKIPNEFKLRADKPRTLKRSKKEHKRSLADYIEKYRGIKLPVSTMTGNRVYNSLIHYLKL